MSFVRLAWSRIVPAIVLAMVSSAGSAAVLITNATPGYYNDLGTVLNDVSTTAPFPCDYTNPSCGDLGLIFTEGQVLPELAPAMAALGTWRYQGAPVGGTWSAAPVAIPASWALNTENAIAYSLNPFNDLTNASIQIGVDNGVFVWLNSTYLLGTRQPGTAVLGEHTINIPFIPAGSYLWVIREDHGAASDYSIVASATVVPEPGTLALLGAGLMGLVAMRRRRARL